MAICMQDGSTMLYALLRLRGEAKVLKLEKKSIYETFILAAYGFWQ